MTLAPVRPALAAPPPAAAVELTEPMPAAAAMRAAPTATAELSPRPHYIAAAAAAGAECAIALTYWLLRPLPERVLLVLLLLATVAGSTLVAAAGFISSGKPMPPARKA